MSVDGINDVTKALSQLIESQIKRSVASAKVTLLPPGDTLPEDVGVNLYLYRVVESSFARNQPWRGDGSHGPSGRPPLALQLHYLLTPLGKASEASAGSGDVTHTMLGVAMVALHEHPVLNDVHIAGFDADTILSQHLRDSYEQVKVTLSAVGIEELSKIWATINKPYRLSVAYEASLVELLPDREPAAGAAAVTRAGVGVVTVGQPQLGSLSPAAGALARLVAGAVTANELTLTGSGLGLPGDAPTVRVGGRPAPLLAPATPPFTELTVALPDDLDAGPQAGVRVAVAGRDSEPLPFLVTPWLAGITPVRTALDPAVAADATLTLAGQGIGEPFTVRFDGPGGSATAAGAVAPDGVATAPVPTDLANGAYEVRVALADAAGSLSNPRTLQVVPLVDAGPAVSVEGGGQRHRLDLTGARLDGAEIDVVVDGVTCEVPANADPAALSVSFGRLLAAGTHSVLVQVDGQRSRSVAFTVQG
jgi:Pvc16 N-terminal domain